MREIIIRQVFLAPNLLWISQVGGHHNSDIAVSFTCSSSHISGVSLVWLGCYKLGMPWAIPKTSEATYTVDGQSFPFDTTPKAKPEESLNLQLLFQTPQSLPGNHTLKVEYQGSNLTSPLTLQGLIIKALSFSGPSRVPAAPSVRVQSRIEELAGGLVGGAALLILGVAVLLCTIRRKRRRNGVTPNVAFDTLLPIPFSPTIQRMSTVGRFKVLVRNMSQQIHPQARYVNFLIVSKSLDWMLIFFSKIRTTGT